MNPRVLKDPTDPLALWELLDGGVWGKCAERRKR